MLDNPPGTKSESLLPERSKRFTANIVFDIVKKGTDDSALTTVPENVYSSAIERMCELRYTV